MDVALVMFKSDGARRDFPIAKARFVIGRTTHCDLRIPLSSVSRQHCEIRIEGNRVHLRDLASSNGTYHNSTRVLDVTLKAGDEIAIGPVVFTLMIDGQPAQIAPVRAGVTHGKEGPAAKKPAPAPVQASAKTGELKVPDEIPSGMEPEIKLPAAEIDDPIAELEALAKSEEQSAADIPLLVKDDDEDSTHQAGDV